MRPSTSKYNEPVEADDDLYTIDEFMDRVEHHVFMDYDGFGYPVKDGLASEQHMLHPSEELSNIPLDATHVVWFNK